MRKTQQIAAAVVFLLAGFTIYGLWATRQPLPAVTTGKANSSVPSEKSLVDQSPLKTAQQMAQLVTTLEERTLAQQALRLADYEVDLAFDTALRQARLHPPALTAEAKEIQARLQKAQKLLATDQEGAKRLAEQEAKAPASKKEAIEADLIQAEADMELDQDEVDDAKEDFIRAGGDLTDRIQAMKKEHEESTHASSSAIPTGSQPPEELGLIHRASQWRALHQKQLQLWQAKSAAESASTRLTAQHDALDAQIDAAKASLPELAHHSKKNKADTAAVRVSAADKSQADTAGLLKATEQLTEDQKALSSFDKRIETHKELAGVYAQWIDLVAGHQRAIVNRMLIGVAIILIIAVVALFFSSWMDSLVRNLSMDRRQVESLRTVVRVASQIFALFLVLLVIFGPPGQLGTFLGLAGAGLTVALKDFIVGFIGWFVLMGKNGIRLGDWVEINGVTGEVAQIGPFHTVLLETGNWTDSGHPTGRRVTFTNGYAIEGHFFNFSTSGQWLWDELQVVLPAGQDSFPLIDAIHKKVSEVTRESAQIAEREWRDAGNARELSGFSAEPAISVKPVVGGIEVSVRYITRATERYKLRSQLNQAAVDLLGGRVEKVAT
ncbi:MAG TPA: mechanosensitive ion channel domain-containing protein [Candidatus Sulfotelmatobacter sp.]|nr:mechanosensitive ion channel domain-containing protein [Candidatus Sulfotelmatobacter sp.]